MTMTTKGMIISSLSLNGLATKAGERDCGGCPPLVAALAFPFLIHPMKWIADDELLDG